LLRTRPTREMVSEQVIVRVHELIRRGELQRGDRLPPEREFARQLGINRTSLRSGLRSLIDMGVLRSRQGSGTFVSDSPPSLDSEALEILAALHGFTQDEVFEARRVLESTIASMAAERATGEQLTCMAEEVISLYAAVDDPQAFLVHDLQFHRTVANASGNPVLAAVAGMVSAMHYELRSQTVRKSDSLRVAADMHQGIFRAIRAGNPEAARTAMRNHILQAQMDYNLEPAADLKQSAVHAKTRHKLSKIARAPRPKPTRRRV